MEIKTIDDLFVVNIDWPEVALGEFETEIEGKKCLLEINDFPDEPMYTLSWNGQSIDFDDRPSCWILHFDQQMRAKHCATRDKKYIWVPPASGVGPES